MKKMREIARKITELDKEEIPAFIRQEALTFIRSCQTPEEGLRLLPGWISGIKFELQENLSFGKHKNIEALLKEGVRLISNDL
jgi:hypothetical protein